MGFYQIDYEILDTIREFDPSSTLLRGGGHILEFGAQDVMQDRSGKVLRSAENRISAREAYREYGIQKYVCVDPEGWHGALPYDLGEDLEDKGLTEQFDIVTIKEIGHWVFDQKTLWRNIHKRTKKGGYIIWRSPIAGGFGAGCFVYMPNKILQLGFCNNYLYKGAWVYKEVGEIPCGMFGSWSQERVYRFESFKAADFLPLLRQYLQKNLLSVQMECGIPVVRLTMVFQKTQEGEFVVPFFPYRPLQECILRNTKAIVANCFPPKTSKVAIFGTAEAGNLARIFCKNAGLEIVCFIDDYTKGECAGREIVDFDTFALKYAAQCHVILKGPYQKGEIESRAAQIPIPVLELNMRWFV